MKTVTIAHTKTVPALGQGTWFMGDSDDGRDDEIAALRRGVELGMSVIDTAEMYGSGASERLVGEAIEPIRDDVFLVSKVLPFNASHQGTIAACEQSLKRLRTDRIDLYLLHWRGPTELEETVAAFEELQQAGKILHWGVSNFDADDMDELMDTPGGQQVATNQVLYNLMRRGIEWDLLPQSEADGTAVMAYSPIEQAQLLLDPSLQKLAEDMDITVSQLALSWVLRNPNVIAIPKAGSVKHVEENVHAREIELPQEVLDELDMIFPAPLEATALEIL